MEAERDALSQRASPAAPIRVVPSLGERIEKFLRDLQRALRHNPDQARMYLRRLLAGPVFLEPDGDLLYANFAMDGTRVALIAGATPGARDLDGSGGVNWLLHSPEFVDVELRQASPTHPQTPRRAGGFLESGSAATNWQLPATLPRK